MSGLPRGTVTTGVSRRDAGIHIFEAPTVVLVAKEFYGVASADGFSDGDGEPWWIGFLGGGVAKGLNFEDGIAVAGDHDEGGGRGLGHAILVTQGNTTVGGTCFERGTRLSARVRDAGGRLLRDQNFIEGCFVCHSASSDRDGARESFPCPAGCELLFWS